MPTPGACLASWAGQLAGEPLPSPSHGSPPPGPQRPCLLPQVGPGPSWGGGSAGILTPGIGAAGRGAPGLAQAAAEGTPHNHPHTCRKHPFNRRCCTDRANNLSVTRAPPQHLGDRRPEPLPRQGSSAPKDSASGPAAGLCFRSGVKRASNRPQKAPFSTRGPGTLRLGTLSVKRRKRPKSLLRGLMRPGPSGGSPSGPPPFSRALGLLAKLRALLCF